MAADRALPDRRAALRIGGGVVAVAIGIGAGIVDRRNRDDTAAIDPPPTPPPEASSSTTSASTTTTTAPAASTAPPAPEIDVPDVSENVLSIGRAYLEARPRDADLAILVSLLPPEDGDVIAAASGAIAADFTRGATVLIDGWVLAESEARAAAILVLAGAGSC